MAENIIVADFELILGCLANRADPILRQFIKGCARRNMAFRVAPFRVVDVPANKTYVLLHIQFVSLHTAAKAKFSIAYLAWQSIHDTGPDDFPAILLSLWQAMQFLFITSCFLSFPCACSSLMAPRFCGNME